MRESSGIVQRSICLPLGGSPFLPLVASHHHDRIHRSLTLPNPLYEGSIDGHSCLHVSQPFLRSIVSLPGLGGVPHLISSPLPDCWVHLCKHGHGRRGESGARTLDQQQGQREDEDMERGMKTRNRNESQVQYCQPPHSYLL